jgi:hypothetical protein
MREGKWGRMSYDTNELRSGRPLRAHLRYQRSKVYDRQECVGAMRRITPPQIEMSNPEDKAQTRGQASRRTMRLAPGMGHLDHAAKYGWPLVWST